MRAAALAALTAAATLAPLAVGPATAAAAVPKGPSGSAFYRAPASVVRGPAGTPIRARAVSRSSHNAVPGASRTLLVLYRSRTAAGRATATSGLVSLPRGRAPRGGWPIVSFAHGTSGIADACAPSRDRRPSSVRANRAYLTPLLTRWLKRGYAVVRTDYQGLGTAGAHEYLVGRSEAAAVLDLATAARRLDRRVGRALIVAGHSQGGHAALWAGARARAVAPGLRLRGVVAYAPASNLADQIGLARAYVTPGFGYSALIGLIVRGLDEAGQVDPREALSDAALALYPSTLTTCIGELSGLSSWGRLSPRAVLRSDYDTARIAGVLRAQGPETLRFGRIPVYVAQGTADQTVLPVFTRSLVAKLRAGGARSVSDRTFSGADHGTIITRAAASSTAWMARRLGR
ncbi:lipase family protein [Paraconexibacter algicola]|uniref:Alpha/beta fold hydrolase n=1 Tax=Paraconexibacter algicola TaxID=2133960 RepID=A0A2T4UJM5_9ACTN|nr:lipase family protein [Paraconexibacter algicola]PTL59454.1 hypothetical protein C7Y72_07215 [Paraconexibacter algicola]